MNTPHVPIADERWEARWFAPEASFDPWYERTTDALRRWIDGMERALVAKASRRQGSSARR